MAPDTVTGFLLVNLACRQDEAGTPWCITVDAQSVEDGTFTVRERDSMQQKRMTYAEFLAMMYEALEF